MSLDLKQHLLAAMVLLCASSVFATEPSGTNPPPTESKHSVTVIQQGQGMHFSVQGLSCGEVTVWSWNDTNITVPLEAAIADSSAKLQTTEKSCKVEWQHPPAGLTTEGGQLSVDAVALGVSIKSAPTVIGIKYKQVSAGTYHTCGLKIDNTLVCWGYNGSGQAMPPTDFFKQVSAGGDHTCGLKTDNTLTCWGYNGDGQAEPPTGFFKQISAGGDHTCGLKIDNTLACWGSNIYGETTERDRDVE
ncbi:exported hypothetical protein [Gammaproteobacteria bacterium]